MIFFKHKDQLRDITLKADELSKEINKLRKENSQFKTILDNMAEGVVAVDKDGKLLSVNPTIEKMFGILDAQCRGKIFLEVIRNNDIFEVIEAVLKSGNFISKELNIVLPVAKTFQVNASAIFEHGKVSGCLLVVHDITEIRRLERVRSDFVANVSHELKTPLTSIKGFVETLLEGALDDKENSRSFLRIIQGHSGRLESLVDDLLSLSSLESQEAILKKESFSARQKLQEVILGFRSQLKKKNIEIHNELRDDVLLTADKDRMQQVFTNLVDNAIKFNKTGGFIKVSAERVDGKIKISIEDSGSGIPANDIPRIFERFYRVDKARSRELGGTGLGLSIVKHIIELHNGSVGVESTEGLGSKFWFILP